ncbi:MAG: YlxR family protein [Clostridia bacterium]|nr:YlxR family protein [Clostridia bacterium]
MSNYKIPMRMCVACRQMYPKKDMIRVTRNNLGIIQLDAKGKSEGRGAYVCNKKECLIKCSKSKLLNKAFKCNISEKIYDELQEKNE